MNGKKRFISERLRVSAILGAALFLAALGYIWIVSFKTFIGFLPAFAFTLGAAGYVCVIYHLVFKPYRETKKIYEQFVMGYVLNDLFKARYPLTPESQQAVQKLNEMIDRNNLISISKKQAEYLALQNQINPHFLYNTLDSINWMLMDIGADDISDVVVSLGDILKYSIHGKDVLVPLNEEVQYIESYLCIQKNRLEDRLCTSMEIQKEARARMVPKLILQPMVENAILHGIEPMKDGGRVRITAGLEQQNLLITIEDNGPGMAPEELEQCRAAVYSESGATDSIGMRNVHRRLRLHFGEEYGLAIESRHQEGTIVTLRMPGTRLSAEQEQGTDGHSDCG